jgi:hypothetical protein
MRGATPPLTIHLHDIILNEEQGQLQLFNYHEMRRNVWKMSSLTQAVTPFTSVLEVPCSNLDCVVSFPY